MTLLLRLKPCEAALVRTYRFGGKNDEPSLIEPAGGCGERITQLRSVAKVNAQRQADLVRFVSRIRVIAEGFPVPAAKAALVLGSKVLRDRLNELTAAWLSATGLPSSDGLFLRYA